MTSILRFPTMLRKMWSGGEVQDWLDANQELKDLGAEVTRLREERDSYQRVGIQAQQRLTEAEKLLRKVDMRPAGNTAEVPHGWWNQRADFLLSLPGATVFTSGEKPDGHTDS